MTFSASSHQLCMINDTKKGLGWKSALQNLLSKKRLISFFNYASFPFFLLLPSFRQETIIIVSHSNEAFPCFFRHAGTIYAFLFSSDIVNNLMVATLTTTLKEKFCYSGLFLIISIWGIVALIATLLYPKSPDPVRSLKKREEKVGQKEYKRAPGIETEMT